MDRLRLSVGLRAISVCALCLGCASQKRGPYFGDERFIVVGVDPRAEAAALSEQLRAAGRHVRVQLDGSHFSAIGFGDARGRSLGVRVVTARGIELALDPVEGDALTEPERYRLLPPPLGREHDADGDSFEEVFVERFTGTDPSRCVLVYRVRDSGFVDPVRGGLVLAGEPRSDEPIWLAPHYCDAAAETDAGVDGGPDGASPSPQPESAAMSPRM